VFLLQVSFHFQASRSPCMLTRKHPNVLVVSRAPEERNMPRLGHEKDAKLPSVKGAYAKTTAPMATKPAATMLAPKELAAPVNAGGEAGETGVLEFLGGAGIPLLTGSTG